MVGHRDNKLEGKIPAAVLGICMMVASLLIITDNSGAELRSSTVSPQSRIQTVSVGINSVTSAATYLLLIANKMGYARANGVSFQLNLLSNTVIDQALSSGTVNLLAASSAEPAILEGAPFKVLAGAMLEYWQLWAKNGIASWSDLAGQKIGMPCPQSSTCNSFMINLLRLHNVNPSSVTMVYTSAQANFEALEAGSVDVALTGPPYTYDLQSTNEYHPIKLTGASTYMSTQFTTTTAYATGDRRLMSSIVKAIAGAESILDQPTVNAKALAIINNYLVANGIDPSTIDNRQFFKDAAKGKWWALVPTRALIRRDLALIAAIPDPALQEAANAASFGDIVYPLPQFAKLYG